MTPDLSEALKEATKEVHTQAENAEFMRNFQKGQITRKGFKVCGPALAGDWNACPRLQDSALNGDWDQGC